jgi:Protein of unknown function (DUF1236)
MKRQTSTLITAAAFLVAFGLTAAQAGAQSDPMAPGGGPAGSIGAGEGGGMAPASPGGGPNQPGNAPGASDMMDTGPGSAASKGSTAEAPPSAKEPKGAAGTQTGMPSDRKDSRPDGDKAGTTAEGQPDTKDGMSKDDKPGATAEGKDDKDGMSKDDKPGATAEGKDDAKSKGKSARLESKDISKVRSHFSQNKPNVKRIDRDDFSVSIGIALPGSIVLYDLPPDVIVVSGPCPIQYFVWGDDIVLVDSCSREVVEIIAGVA